MSDTYSTGFLQYLPDAPVDPVPAQEPFRLTVHPQRRGGELPLGPPGPPPITLTPVDYQPDFSIHLHPVEHQPIFYEQPNGGQLAASRMPNDAQTSYTDEQLRLLASQKDQIAHGPHETLGGVGTAAIQNYQDYFDPFTKNEQGQYIADLPMTPNAQGKVPAAQKDWTNDALAGADMATLLPLPGGGAVKAIMAGVAAKGANLAKLAHAAELEKAGQNPSIIRQLTDWFRGADGIWRFEIPDTDARWLGRSGVDAKRQLLQQQIADLYKQRDGVFDVVTQQSSDPALTSRINAKITELDKQLFAPTTMGDLVDHPKLYEQYPHVAEMPTTIMDLGGAVNGQQIPSAKSSTGWGDIPGRIELDTKKGTNRLTALHEIMHEVQDTEGFARGGNYSTPEVAAEVTAQTGQRRSELLAQMEELNARKARWITHQTGLPEAEFALLKVQKDRNYPSVYHQLSERFWKDNPDAARKLNELQADTHQLNAAHQRALHQAYRRLAGEVESRNVERRAGMTPNELARVEPHLTEDVPRDKQIVIKREGDTASIDDGGAPARVNEGLHEPIEGDRGLGHEREGDQAAAEAARPNPSIQRGGEGGAGGLAEAQRAAADAAGSKRPLEGLPQEPLIIAGKHYIPGPIERIHQIAEDYMKSTGRPYKPLASYEPVKVKRAERIAEQYEKMPHAPNDPAVKASYDAMIDETVAQLHALQKSGLKIEFIKPGMADPYAETPRMAALDVRDNNHLWVFPTDAGFGTDAASAEALKDNPLLRPTGIHIDGQELLANDAFRIVHDFFGHLKDGVGFRAGGEENAWRSHSRMYSPLARKAMTSETRGQNSWLNYGPHGAKNRTAKSSDTIYADQKTGIMPNWTHLDGAADPFVAPPLRDERGHSTANAGIDAPTNKSVQTVADPHRMMYPGIYESPRRIVQDAAERVAPENINMKRLWGVSRGDLDEMAKTRVGNEEPKVVTAKNPRGSLAAQNLQTPKNTQRLIDILAEAGKHPGLKHADAWYILDPVYQHMEKMFGPEEAKKRFTQLNTLMGMASPSSPVLEEIQRGTAANHMATEGRFDDFLKYAGIPEEFRKGPADLQHVTAHPYHRTAQAEPMQKFLETGAIQSKKPKVPAYVHASGAPETGFQTTGMVGDAHFARGVGLPDTRTSNTQLGKSISGPEYQTIQPWWRDEVARELGIEVVPAQARLWTALAPRTGVDSPLGQGKLELLTQQIMKAAKRLRVTPEQARDLILSGKAGAGAVAAGAVGAGAAGNQFSDGLQDYLQ